MSMSVQATPVTWGVGDWFSGTVSQFWLQGDQSHGGYTILSLILHEYDPSLDFYSLGITELEELWNYEGFPGDEMPLTIVGDMGAIHPTAWDEVTRGDYPAFPTITTTEIDPAKMYVMLLIAGYGDGGSEDCSDILFFNPMSGAELPPLVPDIFLPPYWTPVPEPMTGMLVLAGASALMLRRRKRNA